MIDEELYKIASEELNSDDRKPDVWARACALASDDHDEARFLYTNLRVEEMLNKDGKQRTFSTTRDRTEDLSGADKLDTLELSLEDVPSPGPSSTPTGVTDNESPLPIDDILGYDANDTNAPSSTAGNAIAASTDDSDTESWTELESLAQANASSTGALSGLTGKAIESRRVDDIDELEEFSESDIVAVSEGSLSQAQDQPSPEAVRSAQLSENLEQQFSAMEQPEPVPASVAKANLQEDENSTQLYAVSEPARHDDNNHLQNNAAAEHARQDSVRPDYADGDILDEQDTLNIDSELDSGTGRSFMVFSRNGALKAIKRGVSWPALLFTFPWLLSKAMFGTALIYGCLWLVSLAGLFTTANQWMAAGAAATLGIKLWTLAFALLALIGLLYIPFRYGNRWIADKLQNRGYVFESAVSASNKNDAIDRLLNHSD